MACFVGWGTPPHAGSEKTGGTPPGGVSPPTCASLFLGAFIEGGTPPGGVPPLYMPQKSSCYAMLECQKTVSLQSRRPERPRSSRDHHSKPLGTICRSSASTFSAGATLKCHISGIPALPETRGIPDPPDPASDPFNGGGTSPGSSPPIKRVGGRIRDVRGLSGPPRVSGIPDMPL